MGTISWFYSSNVGGGGGAKTLAKTQKYKSSFRINGATVWNKLPSAIRNTHELELFKKGLDTSKTTTHIF